MKELFAKLAFSDLHPGEGHAPRTLVEAVPLRPIPRMSADTPLYHALNFFQTGRSHMAVIHSGDTLLFLDREHRPAKRANKASAGGLARTRSAERIGTPAQPGPRPSLLSQLAPSATHAAQIAATPRGQAPPPPPIIVGPRTAGASHPPMGEVLGILTLEDVLEARGRAPAECTRTERRPTHRRSCCARRCAFRRSS